MLWSLLLLACHGPDDKTPTLTLSPSSGSSAGYYTVEADLSAAGLSATEVLGLTVGGVNALMVLAEDEDTLSFQVQGAPEPGPADVVLRTAAGEQTFMGAFTFDAPIDPVFDRMVSIGASLSMGAVSAVVTHEDGLANGPARIAQQTGAFLGLPLLVDGLMTPVTLADLGPGCSFPNYADHASAQVTGLLSALEDPETGEANPRLGRLDPDLEVRNHAVAGTNVGEFLDPSDVGLGEVVFGHIINEPDAGLFDPLSLGQLALAEAHAPTLILALDPLVNDGVDAVTSGEALDTDEVTPVETLEPDLRALVDGLAATGAEVFLGNSPRPSALPIAEQAAASMIAAGAAPDDVEAAINEIEAAVSAQNALLDELAAAYPNVHVVDFAAAVDALDADGLDVGDAHLTTEAFGGLVGLDGIHYTHTGYAVMANITLAAMREALGVSVEDVDLEAVLATDQNSPDALAAAGLDLSACD